MFQSGAPVDDSAAALLLGGTDSTPASVFLCDKLQQDSVQAVDHKPISAMQMFVDAAHMPKSCHEYLKNDFYFLSVCAFCAFLCILRV